MLRTCLRVFSLSTLHLSVNLCVSIASACVYLSKILSVYMCTCLGGCICLWDLVCSRPWSCFCLCLFLCVCVYMCLGVHVCMFLCQSLCEAPSSPPPQVKCGILRDA